MTGQLKMRRTSSRALGVSSVSSDWLDLVVDTNRRAVFLNALNIITLYVFTSKDMDGESHPSNLPFLPFEGIVMTFSSFIYRFIHRRRDTPIEQRKEPAKPT